MRCIRSRRSGRQPEEVFREVLIVALRPPAFLDRRDPEMELHRYLILASPRGPSPHPEVEERELEHRVPRIEHLDLRGPEFPDKRRMHLPPPARQIVHATAAVVAPGLLAIARLRQRQRLRESLKIATRCTQCGPPKFIGPGAIIAAFRISTAAI